MLKKRLRRTVIGFLAVTAGGVAGCSDTPTTPVQAPQMTLSDAQIVVGGRVINGGTMDVGHDDGESTLFRACLQDPDGPRIGHRVQVRYQRPGMMGMMQGSFMLFDDGTHGDPIAGDGWYCLDDRDGMYGCNARGASPGDYHFDFCGYDERGRESNHRAVTVHLQR